MIQFHSDTYKERYGFRPRKDWDGFSRMDIERVTDDLLMDIREDEKLDAQREEWARFVQTVPTSGTGWSYQGSKGSLKKGMKGALV
jgi:hypothetical protein